LAYDIEITKEFRFDAAHRLPLMPDGHPYTRMHGHSFRVAITLAEAPDPAHGWIADFAEIEATLESLRATLDHQTLNEIPGLENPTLEIIARWIFERAANLLPGLRRVALYRDSVGESCVIRTV
jgi:6-pyruvoyltetrahydropterin/6-carboxytetrahydropterin synthase